MRAGNLRHRATILSLSADLSPVDHGARWVSIRAKDVGDVAAPVGLRSTGLVEVRARYTSELQQGRYLLNGSRLLYIASAPRDPMGTKAEMVMSCAELVGQAAEYRPAIGLPIACRVHLTHQAPYRDEMGQATDYRTRAEVAIIEVGRPEAGDQVLVEGVLYNVDAYADETDDGVVRGLWLDKVA